MRLRDVVMLLSQVNCSQNGSLNQIPITNIMTEPRYHPGKSCSTYSGSGAGIRHQRHGLFTSPLSHPAVSNII